MVRTLAAAAVGLALVGGAAQAQETKILFNSFLQPKHVLNTGVIHPWAGDIAKATEGRVKIEIPPSSLAAPQQQYDSVVRGVMDGAYMFHGFLADRVKLAPLAHLPWGSTTPKANSLALWRTHERFFAKADEYKDVQLLALFVSVPGQIFAIKAPVQSLADLKGVKYYGLPGVPAKILEMAGAAVVAAPAARSHEIISSGTVDGFAGYALTDAYSFHTLQYAKSVTELPGHLTAPSFALFVNKKKWQSIPKRDQEILTKMSGAAFAARMSAYDAAEALARKDAEARGTSFIKASDAFVAELKKLSAPLEQAWIADAQKLGVDGKAALEFYRAESQKQTQ